MLVKCFPSCRCFLTLKAIYTRSCILLRKAYDYTVQTVVSLLILKARTSVTISGNPFFRHGFHLRMRNSADHFPECTGINERATVICTLHTSDKFDLQILTNFSSRDVISLLSKFLSIEHLLAPIFHQG